MAILTTAAIPLAAISNDGGLLPTPPSGRYSGPPQVMWTPLLSIFWMVMTICAPLPFGVSAMLTFLSRAVAGFTAMLCIRGVRAGRLREDDRPTVIRAMRTLIQLRRSPPKGTPVVPARKTLDPTRLGRVTQGSP